MATTKKRSTTSKRTKRSTAPTTKRATKKRATKKRTASVKSTVTRYGKAAAKAVKSAIERAKRGTLKGGAGRHPKVKSRKQAIAIGLSEARKKGAKVPARRKPASRKSRSSR